MALTHVPVLFQEVMEALDIKPDGIYVDATFGRGGHSRGILERLGPSGRLIAVDRDDEALKEASSICDPRFSAVKGVFSEISVIAASLEIAGRADGLLLDLGVSSPQLDDPERGFSFIHDGPLDMRMDPSQDLTAAVVVNTYDKEKLSFIFKNFGEERFAKRIASAIVSRRSQKPFSRTGDLAKVIEQCIPGRTEHKHKATRCFQALRIEVNHELEELEAALDASIELLKPGGVLCVITFHSLEDRMVKNFIKKYSQGPKFPSGLPLTAAEIEQRALEHVVFKKGAGPIRASSSELSSNVRARSALLRQAVRVGRGL